ncbi:ABC transporter ATP-binding protein [Paenibacillus thermotolerans]|uniref:ABC transporter ATP-binding protein n=1 Tax=Paenibacillus thermotolerans TaxID=3027807 RepID=UPI002368B5DF|nr:MULTISPECIES: sn-glycerol-3-phosphate ABC transporter ATP-binding protein UgpC [unclassified Paenibacillus]
MGSVSFQHVKKKYAGERRYSVDDFHLEVEDGEFLVLVGPSGCGKSTLLRMLAGLEEISEGEIYIGDQMVNYVSSKDRNIAMVFQNYALYPHMTVYENIAFGLRLRKMAKHEIHEHVIRAAKVLEIEPLLTKLPRQMSGGQRQRVALGRAIVREPEVFLMDEPLSNLDAKLRVQMREEITKLHRKLKTTMIYVTHDQIEAMTMGTRIVVMRGGVIQQVGTPKEIYTSPKNMFVAGFIGTPPMNFIQGKIMQHENGVFFETRKASLLIPTKKAKVLLDRHYYDKSVVLGVRAEQIACKASDDGDWKYSQSRFAAIVELQEFMGSDTFLHVSNGEHSVTVRMDPFGFDVREGEAVTIGLDMNNVHFFDPQTEEVIC